MNLRHHLDRGSHSERGQSTVLAVLFMTVLLGLTALVLDVGSWYRADRATQSTADAAALAGAQALPTDTAQASSLATQYANKNGGGLNASGITFSTKITPNDTITVNLKRSAPGFFSKLFSINSVQVGSKAVARAEDMSAAKYVAPIVVNKLHPKLDGSPSCPCFGPANQTTIPLDKTGAPGAFALVNLDGSKGGTGQSVLAGWMLHGFDAYLNVGVYLSDPGAKWNASQLQDAITQRFGTELLFPVYDTLNGGGANAGYHIIGFVAFHLLAVDASGSSGSITGYFTRVTWEGIQVAKAGETPDFGARAVTLVG